jgi:hypothetical protein
VSAKRGDFSSIVAFVRRNGRIGCVQGKLLGQMMGGRFIRGLAFLGLLSLVTLTSCQASVTPDMTTMPIPQGLRT